MTEPLIIGTARLYLGRHYIGIELNPDYLALAVDRIQPIADQPDLFHAPAPVPPPAPQPAQDTLFQPSGK